MNHELISSGQELAEAPGEKLRQLAERATRAHDNFQASMRQAVAHALEAGQALLEAKALCPDKKWTKWLAAHFEPSASTARGYMRLATYWTQLEGDHQPVGDLTYKELLRLTRGLPNSDGRANTGATAGRRRLAAPTEEADHSLGGELEKTGGTTSPAEVAGEPFARFGQFLHQAIAELRHVIEAQGSESNYARHLLHPLERIHEGLAGYKWHWHDLTPRR
jgi:hypothetical protein